MRMRLRNYSSCGYQRLKWITRCNHWFQYPSHFLYHFLSKKSHTECNRLKGFDDCSRSLLSGSFWLSIGLDSFLFEPILDTKSPQRFWSKPRHSPTCQEGTYIAVKNNILYIYGKKMQVVAERHKMWLQSKHLDRSWHIEVHSIRWQLGWLTVESTRCMVRNWYHPLDGSTNSNSIYQYGIHPIKTV